MSLEQMRPEVVQNALKPQPSGLQKQLCDKFFDEWTFDRSWFLAAIRCGFQENYAKQYGLMLFHEPYVQCKIKEWELAYPENDKLQKKRDAERLMIRLRDMIERPYPASQVAALGKMAAILGLNAPIKTEQNLTHRGGVMQVPGIAEAEAWEQAASASQSALVSDTNADT